MKRRFGVEFVLAYGLTEATPMIVPTSEQEMPPGATGRGSPWFDVALIVERGEPVAGSEVGESVCRPRARVMFARYLDDPEAIARAFRGPWLHTRDLGRCVAFAKERLPRFVRPRNQASARELSRTAGDHLRHSQRIAQRLTPETLDLATIEEGAP